MEGESRGWHILHSLTGVIAVVLLNIGRITSGPIDAIIETSTPSATIAQAFIERRSQLAIGSFIGLLGLVFLLWFIGYLYRYLKRAEGDGGWLAPLAYGSGLITVGVFLGSFALDLAAAAISDYRNDPQVAKTLLVLRWSYVFVFAPPMFILAITTSAIALRYAVLPRWVATSGLLAALSLALPSIGVIVNLIWLFVVSGAMSMRGRETPGTRIPSGPA